MPANKRLYDYLSQHAEEISSTWYQNIEENDPNSIYASTDPVIIENLKRRSGAFENTHPLYYSGVCQSQRLVFNVCKSIYPSRRSEL